MSLTPNTHTLSDHPIYTVGVDKPFFYACPTRVAAIIGRLSGGSESKASNFYTRCLHLRYGLYYTTNYHRSSYSTARTILFVILTLREERNSENEESRLLLCTMLWIVRHRCSRHVAMAAILISLILLIRCASSEPWACEVLIMCPPSTTLQLGANCPSAKQIVRFRFFPLNTEYSILCTGNLNTSSKF